MTAAVAAKGIRALMQVPRTRSSILGAAGLLLLLSLVLRVWGAYPTVFADEWSYSKMARLEPLRDAAVPSYLYLSLFRLSNLCGDSFLGCVRVLNLVCWFAAAPFIWAVAAKFSRPSTAAFVTLLTLAGPSGVFVAFFMPESMYFAAFWILCWICLVARFQNETVRALAIGGWIGIMSAVKVHAIFLIPAVVLFEFYMAVQIGKERRAVHLLLRAALLVGAAFSAKFAVGYAFAGARGLTLLGSLYQSQAGAAWSVDRITELARGVLTNGWGQLLGIFVLYALPVAICFRLLAPLVQRSAQRNGAFALALWTALVLSSLIVLTATFSALVAGTGPYESIGRLHMRYYAFAFPLFLILVSVPLKDSGRYPVWVSLLLVAIMLACAYLISWGSVPAKYQPGFVDSAELFGLVSKPAVFLTLVGISVLALAVWPFSSGKAAKVYLWVFMPLLLIAQNSRMHGALAGRHQADTFDKAGILAHQILGARSDKLAVLSPDTAAGLRTLFHVDNAKTELHVVSAGQAFSLDKISKDREWLLAIGNPDLGAKAGALNFDGFSLIRLGDRQMVEFRGSGWLGLVSRAKGLGVAESWGTWSVSREVAIELVQALPENFRLRVVGRAFGPNVGKPIQVMVGQRPVGEIVLSDQQTEVQLKATAPRGTHTISFAVPHPVTPASLKQGADQRELGIGLVELEVIPVSP